MTEKLLDTVSRFYPIGDRFTSRDFYVGYQDFKEILAKKTDRAVTGEIDDRFKKLMAAVAGYFTQGFGQILYDYGGQFPSYGISIPLKTIETDGFRLISWLNLRISLLDDIYSIFYVDDIVSRRYSTGASFYSSIISSSKPVDDPNGEYIEYLDMTTERCFNGFNKINPRILFRDKVGNGIPHGIFEDIENWKPYPVYDYLFGNEYAHINALPDDHLKKKSLLVFID